MEGHRLQRLIYKGRGHAGQHLGQLCQVFRPQNATAPLTNLVTTLPVSFNAADQNYLKPNLYGKPVWFADLDGTQTCPGDYLVRVSDGKVWFIAAQQQLLPIVAIDCNAWVMVRRQAASTTLGEGPYSGIVDPTYILGTVDSPWPASILIGGRSLAAIGLPADVKESGWRILLPPSVPIDIASDDRLDDTQDRTFWVESAEKTDLGWRLTTNEAHA